MQNLFLAALGGAAGSVARYLVGMLALRQWGSAWPSGTFTVNVAGGLLMGLLVGFLAHRGGADQERLRVLLAVGFLGGFTTFSAYSLEMALMIEKRAYGQAAVYGGLSTALAVSALFAGLLLARRIFA